MGEQGSGLVFCWDVESGPDLQPKHRLDKMNNMIAQKRPSKTNLPVEDSIWEHCFWEVKIVVGFVFTYDIPKTQLLITL